MHRVYRSAQYNTRKNPPNSTADILAFLSDGVDPQYKVYRGNTAVDPYITYTTSLFDLAAKTVHVFTNKPEANQTSLVLDLREPLAWPLAASA